MPVNFPVSLPKADGLTQPAQNLLQKSVTNYADRVVREAGRSTSGQHKEITAELIKDAVAALGRRGRRERKGSTIVAQLSTYLLGFVMTFLGPSLWEVSQPAVLVIVFVVGMIAVYSFYGDR